MRALCIIYVILLSFTSAFTHSGHHPQTSQGGCPSGYGFIFPSSTLSEQQKYQFELGQHIQIQWNSPWPAVKLAFLGQDSTNYIFIDQAEPKPSFGWNVNVSNSEDDNAFYYFYIENENDSSQHCFSSLWNVTDQRTSSNSPSPDGPANNDAIPHANQTLEASTSSKPAGMATEVVTQPMAESTAPQMASASVMPVPAELTTGAKAAIGIGVAFGAVLITITGLLIFLAMRRRSRRDRNDTFPLKNETKLVPDSFRYSEQSITMHDALPDGKKRVSIGGEKITIIRPATVEVQEDYQHDRTAFKNDSEPQELESHATLVGAPKKSTQYPLEYDVGHHGIVYELSG